MTKRTNFFAGLWGKKTRIDRRLRIEELEPRCAPVTLAIGQVTVYPFTDAHGNQVKVTLSGQKGSVTLLDSLGHDPSHTDIATAVFSNANATTSLLVDVLQQGSANTVVGSITASGGQALGNITVDGNIGSLTAGSVKVALFEPDHQLPHVTPSAESR